MQRSAIPIHDAGRQHARHGQVRYENAATASDHSDNCRREQRPARPGVVILFFFSSRRRHTRSLRDWIQTCALPILVRLLRPGRYVFTATHEGMFGGRDYAYLTVVPPGAAASPLAPAGRSTPSIARTLPPVAAALVAAAFALLLGRAFLRRPAGQKALWGAGFLLFAAAASCEALAQGHGWTPLLFRGYYLCGGVLAVGMLGAGSAWLLLPRRGRDVLVGALAVA